VFAFMTTVLVRSAWNTTYLFRLSKVVGSEWNPYFAVQMALGALPLLILLGGSLSRRSIGPRELRPRELRFRN
jgi:ABC-type phosphate transport system permease subunit